MKMLRRTAALLLCLACLSGGAFAAEEAGNAPPVAENLELETYRGVSVGGRLSAFDADGDEVFFEVETEPMKGTVELSPDGFFVYTPAEGKRGRDYFGFRAVDSEGNASQEGTVIIRLKRQSTRLTYADMAGDPNEYAAVMLTERGVFAGASLGADAVFDPADTVTRGEFLALCMNAAGQDALAGVQSTGFADDGSIAPWQKPYVATALMEGFIRGQSDPESGAPVFRPNDAVTLRDACVMLNAVLGVTDVVSVASWYGGDETAPEAQAVANLSAAGVMLSRWDDLDASVTRAQAAELLKNAMALLDRRG